MRYVVVATTSWLLLVDLQSRQVQPLEHTRSEYYGISWFADNQELVLSHSGLDNASLLGISEYSQSERGWLSKGEKTSKPFLSQPHQIICAPDGRVICSNTGRNVISVFDFNKPNLLQEEGISAARWDRLSLKEIIGDHLNSVFLRDGKLFVIAHGHSLGAKLAVFSYPDLELLSVQKLGERTGLHNIWVTVQGQCISCHSENGSLIDLNEKYPLWESGASIYTRGLAATDNFVVVGESQKTGRDLRRSSLSGLWIIDRSNWRAIDYFCLGPYGAVNEVRILDEGDDAHHGYAFSGLRSLLTKDMRLEMLQARLSASTQAAIAQAMWRDYKAIFGSPMVTDDGGRQASEDQLCLLVKQDPEDSELAFRYVLESKQGAHVSAILGYRGEGADRCMAAFLLQARDSDCVLSVWKHDGQEWSSLPQVFVFNLPLKGTMQLFSTTDHAALSIDGVEVVSLSGETLGLDRCDLNLGIRWIGATVWPVGMMQ